jgi:hypothetical protein
MLLLAKCSSGNCSLMRRDHVERAVAVLDIFA